MARPCGDGLRVPGQHPRQHHDRAVQELRLSARPDAAAGARCTSTCRTDHGGRRPTSTPPTSTRRPTGPLMAATRTLPPVHRLPRSHGLRHVFQPGGIRPHSTRAWRRSFPGAVRVSPVTQSADGRRAGTWPGNRGPRSRSCAAPDRALGRRQRQAGSPSSGRPRPGARPWHERRSPPRHRHASTLASRPPALDRVAVVGPVIRR